MIEIENESIVCKCCSPNWIYIIGNYINKDEIGTIPTADMLSGKNAHAWVSMDFT